MNLLRLRGVRMDVPLFERYRALQTRARPFAARRAGAHPSAFQGGSRVCAPSRGFSPGIADRGWPEGRSRLSIAPTGVQIEVSEEAHG